MDLRLVKLSLSLVLILAILITDSFTFAHAQPFGLVRSGTCLCMQNYSPVCGSNGKTYDNSCFLECVRLRCPKLKIAYNGICQTPNQNAITECVCPRNYNPVCGSDGRTYENSCEFQCMKKRYPYLSVAHLGSCYGRPWTTRYEFQT